MTADWIPRIRLNNSKYKVNIKNQVNLQRWVRRLLNNVNHWLQHGNSVRCRHLSRIFYISADLSLIELDSKSHQHVQLCGYLQRGSPLCELLRNVNTSTTVTGTIICLGSVLHWCRALCVSCCQLLINPCGVSQNTVEDRQRKKVGIQHCARLSLLVVCIPA